MAEVDNIFYSFGLPERVKVRMERMGRVALSEEQAKQLGRTKCIWIFLVMTVIMLSLRFPLPDPFFGTYTVGIGWISIFSINSVGPMLEGMHNIARSNGIEARDGVAKVCAIGAAKWVAQILVVGAFFVSFKFM